MSFEEVLMGAGFGAEEAKKLAANKRFAMRNRNKTSQEIASKIHSIALTYLASDKDIRQGVLSFHPFAGYNHQRVLRDIKEAYNCTADRASTLVLKYPSFVGLDHQRVLRDIKEAYNCTAERASKIVLKYPRFAGFNHQRVLRDIKEAYNCTAERASMLVLKYPPFVDLDHQRVLRDIKEAYNCTADRASKMVLRYPRFAGSKHQRVINQLGRIGRIVGINRIELIETIIGRPELTSYSAKRYIAAIDTVKHLRTEGLVNDQNILQICKDSVSKSPYVPGTDRLRISQVLKRGDSYTEPPLMKVLRKKFEKNLALNS